MDNANSKMFDQPDASTSKVNPGKKQTRRRKGRKRAIVESEEEEEEEESLVSKRRKISETSEDASQVIRQPSLITGATLKPYQLEGLQWMASLHTNGISGILGERHPLYCAYKHPADSGL